MANLTDKFAKAAAAGAGGDDAVFWDDALPCFGLRVKASGARSWLVQYRNAHHQSRRLTLGRVGVMTSHLARKEARQILAAVDRGHDPAAEKAAARNAMTVGELSADYIKWLEKRTQRPVKRSTLDAERGRFENHVKPLLGRKPVRSLDVDAVEKFFQDVADGKTADKPPAEGEKRKRGGAVRGGVGAAHRNTEMLGSFIEYAIAKKAHPGPNPVFLFIRKKQKKLKPAFDIEGVRRVGAAMRELEAEGEPAIGIRFCRHFILTGFRRMEGLAYRWNNLDARAHCARLEDTKTGPQIRALGQAAIDHLLSFKPRDAKAADFMFPGSGKKGHFVGAPKVWGRIANRAGVEGVSIHGLRHWFASAGAELGFSDIIIGAIIGHAKKGTTGIYATAPDSALILAADRIAQYLADALDDVKGSKVLKFRGAEG